MSVLLALQILMCVYSLIILYISVTLASSPFFKFLTHWGIVLVTAYYATAVASHACKALRRLSEVLYVSTWAIQFLICVVFWTWIQPMIKFAIPPFFNYSAHGGLLVGMLLELPLNSVTFYWRDIRVSLLILVLYQLLNVYFTITSGPVYPGLNYSGLDSAVLIIYSIAVYLGSYFFGVALTAHRRKEKTS